jgi:hypothetical protein
MAAAHETLRWAFSTKLEGVYRRGILFFAFEVRYMRYGAQCNEITDQPHACLDFRVIIS